MSGGLSGDDDRTCCWNISSRYCCCCCEVMCLTSCGDANRLTVRLQLVTSRGFLAFVVDGICSRDVLSCAGL